MNNLNDTMTASSSDAGAAVGRPLATRSPKELRDDGKAALDARDPTRAEAIYRALLQNEPNDIWALVGLGFVARLEGRRDRARQRFEEAAAAHPRNTWPLLEISAECRALGFHDEAEAALRRGLELNPNDYHCLMALGRMIRDRASHEDAAELFHRAMERHPTQPAGYTELAAQLVTLDRHGEALATLDAAVAAGINVPAFLKAKAEILRGQGQREAAFEVLARVQAVDPDDSDLAWELASEATELGHHADALVLFRTVIDSPALPLERRRDAAAAASRAARAEKKHLLALELLEQATALDSNHFETSLELANQYRASGRFHDAESFYRAAIGQRPDSLAAVGGLAIVRRQLGDNDDALQLLTRAGSVDPKNEWIRFETAITLRGLGRTDEAGAILELIEPTSSMYY